MNRLISSFVTVGAQVGGRDADLLTAKHVQEFREILTRFCSETYTSDLDEVGLVLRIDGSIQAWQRSGIDAIAVRKSRRIATADIYVPRQVWDVDDNGANFRSFIAIEIKKAIDAVAQQALKRKLNFLTAKLMNDVDAAIVAYLGGNQR